MLTQIGVYVKINNKIAFVLDSAHAAGLKGILRRYGLSYDTFQSIVKAHRSDMARLVGVGVFNRLTSAVSIEHLNKREYIYEIDLDSGMVRAYASGQRAYKSYRLADDAIALELRKAA